jgi:hypothetical protein
LEIKITDAWAELVGVDRRNKFKQQDHLRITSLFYVSNDFESHVSFDFGIIKWVDNSISHSLSAHQYGPKLDGRHGGWWYVWTDYGINNWEPGWYWFQVLAEVRDTDLIAYSPERFLYIIPPQIR